MARNKKDEMISVVLENPEPIPDREIGAIRREPAEWPAPTEIEPVPGSFTDDCTLVPMTEVMEMLRDPDRKSMVDMMYPGHDNVAMRTEAMKLFAKGKSTKDVASELCLSHDTVLYWATRYGWVDALEAKVRVHGREEKARMRALRLDRREKIVTDQLDIAEQMLAAGRAALAEAETASQMKLASEGIKLATDIQTRALGIGESGDLDSEREANAKAAGPAGGRAPLVMVFNGGQGNLPPIKVPPAPGEPGK